MQRLAGDFLVKRSAVVYGPGGAVSELYELPNGQWQFGKGRDAMVVTSIEQVAMCDDPGIKEAVAKWLERTKSQPTPQPAQQGRTPLLAGDSARDQLSRAISVMPEEVVNRLLMAVQQVIGPVADSLTAGAQVNHHSDGYGQDQQVSAPGSVQAAPFELPDGARWADPTNPAGGYLQLVPGLNDEKGVPIMAWHPTPQFRTFVDTAKESDIGPKGLTVEEEMALARAKDPQKTTRGSARQSVPETKKAVAGRR